MWKLVGLGATLVVAILVLTFAQGFTTVREPAVQNLRTVRATRERMFESVVATGTVKPKVGAEVKVGSQLSGVVVKLNVNVGDRVSKGDLLALLDGAALRARADTLRAELNAAIAEEKYAESELRKRERLVDTIPAIDLESSRRNLAVRVANIEQARSRLADAEIQLGYIEIRAPISGVIGSVSTYRGETVAASFQSPTFATIIDLDRLEVQAYVDETDIGRVHVGQRVQFEVDAFRGRPLEGVVRAIHPKAVLVNNVVNYVVIIDITDSQGLAIRPEMTARISLVLQEKTDVIGLPRSAVLTEGDRHFVFAQTTAGLRKKPVKTGMFTTGRIEIVEGLRESEAVLADAQQWQESSERRP
jgi:macrolide-specific efflux system membrane fusion protein